MTTTEPKRIGRPPLTSRAQILNAARAIGFRDLSVGAVTRAVGRKYSSFYRHYASHDELIAALVNEALAEQTWPTAAGWRPHLDALTDTLTSTVAEWPGLPDAIRPLLGTEQEPGRLTDARVTAELRLVAADIRPGLADTAVDTVITLALTDRPHRDGITLVLDGLTARSES